MKRNEDITKFEKLFNELVDTVCQFSDQELNFLLGDRGSHKDAADRVWAAAQKAESEYSQRGQFVPPHIESAIAFAEELLTNYDSSAETDLQLKRDDTQGPQLHTGNIPNATRVQTARCVGTGINIFIDDDPPLTGARIKVIGIGGGGSNAVNRMIEAGIEGIEFLVANTDLQALKRSRAPIKLQLGSRLTKGLGAGADPNVGREAALEDTDKIIEVLEGADIVFVTTGLGGGTGTGAAPIIASLATELDALTVAVVTKPFHFEGRRRMQQADQGLRELRECVDTVITIPNERLLHTVDRGISLADSFKVADDVLRQAVQGISDLITVPGLINLDFADVKSIMQGMGMALMGAGRATGENRAIEATQQAISSPLLEEATIQGAKGVLINITGGPDLTLFEVNAASSIIRESADDDANIIFGAVIDENLTDEMKITVIATGFDREATSVSSAAATTAIPAPPPRFVARPADDLPRPMMGTPRVDDLDVPTFVRKKAE